MITVDGPSPSRSRWTRYRNDAKPTPSAILSARNVVTLEAGAMAPDDWRTIVSQSDVSSDAERGKCRTIEVMLKKYLFTCARTSNTRDHGYTSHEAAAG